MGTLNSFGTIAGTLPAFMGRQFFVAPSASYTIGGRTYVASDGNDGLSPERALLTVAAALALTTASAGDMVVLLPGDHTATASLAMSKAGVTLTGIPGMRSRPIASNTSLTVSASDEIINVTAADVEICNLRIIPITAKTGIDASAAANRLYLHDLYFDLTTPAVNTGTVGFASIGANSQVLIEDCYALSDGAQGPALTLTGTLNSIVRNCTIQNNAGSWAVGVLCGAATKVLMHDCLFVSTGTAMTAGVSGTGATGASGCIFMNNRFSSLVTVGIDNFDAGEAELSENYDAGVGATDGGVLIVAIT